MNKKDPAQRRTKDIKFAVNDAEHALLEERAFRAGKVLATYCRLVVLSSSAKTTSQLNREVWGKLGKAYNNINQALKLAHTLRLEGKPVPHGLLPKLEAELDAIQELRKSLKS
jgi:GTP1/Obg family GTP-binding protein